MKKLINHTKQKILKVLCLLIVVMQCTPKSFGQYIVPVVNADPTYATTYLPVWMNNSLFNNSNGTAYAVVWHESGGSLYLKVADDAGSTPVTQALVGPGIANSSMSRPDVVMGGDGTNNYVGCVYTVDDNNGTVDVYMETYVVTGVGSGIALGLTNCSTYIHNVSNTGTARAAHIDLAYKATGVSWVAADTFVIAWEDLACSNNTVDYGARACFGSLSHIATCATGAFNYASSCLNNTNATTGEKGLQVDIAVRYHPSNQKYSAAFTYDDPAKGRVYVGGWIFGGATNTVTTGVTKSMPGANNMDYPRIDVEDDIPLNQTPQIGWEVTYRYWDGNLWQPVSVNNAALTDYFSYNFGGIPDHDNSNPVVTRNTSKGFAIAYANPGMDKIYLHNVEWATGYLTQLNAPPSYDGYEVSYNAGIDGPVAAATDYVIGPGGGPVPDEEFVCWYNATNGEIDCKTTSASPPVFKPAKTIVMKAADKAQIYPNPASEYTWISAGKDKLTSYTITDMAGRTIMTGNITAEKEMLDIRKLSTGIYVLRMIKANGDIMLTKLVKD